eukprot:2375910-Karenia_brevis.AAC.1
MSSDYSFADEASHMDKIHKCMEDSTVKLKELCDESLKQYAEQTNKIESRATVKLQAIQQDMQDT